MLRVILNWKALAVVLRNPGIITGIFGDAEIETSHHEEFTADLNGDTDDIGVAIESRPDNDEDTP